MLGSSSSTTPSILTVSSFDIGRFSLEMFTMKHDSSYYCQRIMEATFQKNVDALKKFFSSLPTSEEKYRALMDMGSRLPPLPPAFKTADHLVRGCQSLLYLRSYLENDCICFQASSDALISAGLAALLISVYNKLPPKLILQSTPDFLSELGLQTSLSMNRSNGLGFIYLKMKQDALKFLIPPKISS